MLRSVGGASASQGAVRQTALCRGGLPTSASSAGTTKIQKIQRFNQNVRVPPYVFAKFVQNVRVPLTFGR